MKFRYYITDICMGETTGTNDPLLAKELGDCDDLFVVDTETGQWFVYGELHNIEQYKELSE